MLDRVRRGQMPRYRAIVENEIEHKVAVIGDLLDVPRVDTGKLRVDLEPVELGTLVTQAVNACSPAMDARQQSLTIVLPAQRIEVVADRVRLAQILRNVLDNASKWSPCMAVAWWPPAKARDEAASSK